jgi:hypothetical protein
MCEESFKDEKQPLINYDYLEGCNMLKADRFILFLILLIGVMIPSPFTSPRPGLIWLRIT